MKQIQLTYHEENGYLYPDLTLPEQTHHPIGKYGDLYLAFIKAHRKGTYTTLLTTGKLNEHLYMIDTEAKETVRRLTAELVKARGIDEKLKATDSLRWVQEMNNCQSCAEEMVRKEFFKQMHLLKALLRQRFLRVLPAYIPSNQISYPIAPSFSRISCSSSCDFSNSPASSPVRRFILSSNGSPSSACSSMPTYRPGVRM